MERTLILYVVFTLAEKLHLVVHHLTLPNLRFYVFGVGGRGIDTSGAFYAKSSTGTWPLRLKYAGVAGSLRSFEKGRGLEPRLGVGQKCTSGYFQIRSGFWGERQ